MSEILKFGKYQVTIDSENLRFDEATLNHYIQKESAIYDNYASYLALAEKNLQNKEAIYDHLYNKNYVRIKDEGGGSDKFAEAKAKTENEVITAKAEIVSAKYIVNRLKLHLKAWDKNHDNAQSMGHMIRKEMDKLNYDIKSNAPDYALEEKKIELESKKASESWGELDLKNIKID